MLGALSAIMLRMILYVAECKSELLNFIPVAIIAPATTDGMKFIALISLNGTSLYLGFFKSFAKDSPYIVDAHKLVPKAVCTDFMLDNPSNSEATANVGANSAMPFTNFAIEPCTFSCVAFDIPIP